MLGERSLRTEEPASYWLIAKADAEWTETLTVGLGKGQRALPIFSFPDEAELFLSLGGFAQDGWRISESTSGELFSALVDDILKVEYVALDPLPEMVDLMFGTTISLVTLSRQKFMRRLVAGQKSAAM